MNRLNAIQLEEERDKTLVRKNSGLESANNVPADSLGRSLSQEEVIPNNTNGLSINKRNSLLRSSSDCTGSSRRQVHPQPLMSRYAFERRSIRRSKVCIW